MKMMMMMSVSVKCLSEAGDETKIAIEWRQPKIEPNNECFDWILIKRKIPRVWLPLSIAKSQANLSARMTYAKTANHDWNHNFLDAGFFWFILKNGFSIQ